MGTITEEYVRILTETEARSKSNQHRIDDLEGQMDAIHSLATSVAELAVEQKHMVTALTDLKADVKSQSSKLDELERGPARRWDKVIDAAIAALVAAFVAFLLHGGF